MLVLANATDIAKGVARVPIDRSQPPIGSGEVQPLGLVVPG